MFKIFNFLFKKKKSKSSTNENTISTIKNESIIKKEVNTNESINQLVQMQYDNQIDYREEITSKEDTISNIEEDKELQIADIEQNSLTKNEIIFLKEMEGKKVNSKLSKKTEEIVSNAYELRRTLCKEGYLRVQSTCEKLESLKVTELKDILKQNSLKVSGKKSELITRIVECLPEKEVEKLSKGKQYILTEKGLETVNSLTL